MTTTKFYASTNGQTACGTNIRHSGMYLHGELSYRPDARRIETPLTVWYRMTKAEIAAFQADCFEEVCEGCHYDRQNGGTK